MHMIQNPLKMLSQPFLWDLHLPSNGQNDHDFSRGLFKFPVPHVKLEGLYPIGLFTKPAFDFNDGKTLNLVLLLLIYRK